MTFFSVSAASHGRSSRGCRALETSTSDSMVGVSGVSRTTAAGASSQLTGSGATVVTASTLAAYPPAERTKVSSPCGLGWRNSSLAEPPMAPETAETMTYSRPRRSKMRT